MGRGTGVRAASQTSVQIDFRYNGARCREKLRITPDRAGLKAAEVFLRQVNAEIAAGTFDYATRFPNSPRAARMTRNPALVMTVGDLLRWWLTDVERELQPETLADYREYVLNTWLPALGSIRLADFRQAHVRQWVGRQTCSRKRILNLLTPLRQAMRAAVEMETLPADPLARLRIRRPDEQADSTIDPFTPAELEALAAASPEQLGNLWQFWAWTGLRMGEVCALTWADIDLKAGSLTVSKALRGARLKAPKTRAGNRVITLLQPVQEALQRQRAHTQLKGGPVFPNPATGRAWSGDKALRLAWTECVAAAGIRYRFPRQLRHTFASWMLSAGENPLWVARVMGHSDWSMVVRTYGKWIPAVDPQAGERAVALLSKAR